MYSKLSRLFLAVLFFAVSAFSTIEAGNRKISVQGKLTQIDGITPLQGEVDLYLSVYNEAGTKLYYESQSVNLGTTGLMNVELGQGVQISTQTFDSLPFNEQYFLGIQVNSEAEMRPLQKLTSSAQSCASLGDFSVSGKLTTVGNAGIGTTDTSSCKLTVNGGNNNLGALFYRDATGTNMHYIGVSAVNSGAAQAILGSRYSTDGNSYTFLGVGGDNVDGGTGLIIKKGGNVAIGNTNTPELLTLGTSENSNSGRRAVTFGCAGFSLPSNYCQNSWGDKLILWRNSSGSFKGDSVIGVGDIGDIWLKSTAIRFFGFNGTTAAERMRISSTGNVGIGTTELVNNKLRIVGGSLLVDPTGLTDHHAIGGITILHGASGFPHRAMQITPAASGASMILQGSKNADGSVNWITYGVNNVGDFVINPGPDTINTSKAFQVKQLNGGEVWIYGSFIHASSEKYKTNITKISSGLEKIKKLNGVSYDMEKEVKVESDEYTDGKIKEGAKKKFVSHNSGLIAEEVEKVIPEIVRCDEKSGDKGVEYTSLIAYLVEAIKEQQSQIDAQQTQITVQQGQIGQLKAAVDKLNSQAR